MQINNYLMEDNMKIEVENYRNLKFSLVNRTWYRSEMEIRVKRLLVNFERA